MTMVEALREVIFISRSELDELTAEGFKLCEIESIGDKLIRVSTNEEERENITYALAFIRDRTKGYGTVHLLDIQYSASSSILEKSVDLKGLMKFHKYAHDLRTPNDFEFAAEKHEDGYVVYYSCRFNNDIDILLR